MAMYVMNENGDWWEYTPGQAIYVLDTKDIPAEYIEDLALPESWGFEPCSDEFVEFGKKIILNIKGENK